MIYYDLFYTDFTKDREYFVSLPEKSIIVRQGDVSIVMDIDKFIIYVQGDKEILHLLKLAGVDFEEYFLPYEMKMYGLYDVSFGLSTK